MPTQMSGLTSTPATGGTSARVGLRIGSVGHAAMFHGSSFKLYFGNHESTTRIRKSTVPTESAGPSAAFVGPTQPGAAASACARAARGQIGKGGGVRPRRGAAARSAARRTGSVAAKSVSAPSSAADAAGCDSTGTGDAAVIVGRCDGGAGVGTRSAAALASSAAARRYLPGVVAISSMRRSTTPRTSCPLSSLSRRAPRNFPHAQR